MWLSALDAKKRKYSEILTYPQMDKITNRYCSRNVKYNYCCFYCTDRERGANCTNFGN